MDNSTPLPTLIVDDDPGFALIVERRVKAAFPLAEVTHATTLAHARQLLGSNTYSLVLLDQHLPDGRGVSLLNEGLLQASAVLALSSDDASELPASTISSGAQFFLQKTQVSAAFFTPLLKALVQRHQLELQLAQAKEAEITLETVATLVATLKHEINNPLGALLGGAYLLSSTASPEQQEAARLVTESGNRIQHVIAQLDQALHLEKVQKGPVKVFHVPGDKAWK